MVAGSAGTFLIVRTVWQRAQLQGDVADARIAELQRLRGHSEDAPPQVSSLSLSYLCLHFFACAQYPTLFFKSQSMGVPSLLDLRLRRDLAAWWNDGVMSLHETVKGWL